MKTRINIFLLRNEKEIPKEVYENFTLKTELSANSNIYHSRETLLNLLTNPSLYDVALTDLNDADHNYKKQTLNIIKELISYSTIIITGLNLNDSVKILENINISATIIDSEKIVNSDRCKNKTIRVLCRLGIAYSVKGHCYLKEIIMFLIENPSQKNKITKYIYPFIANKFNTTAASVERAIRRAIEMGWDKGDYNTIIEIFGNSIDYEKERPTNLEFIMALVEKLK